VQYQTSLKCVLTHYCDLHLVGDTVGSVQNKRLVSVTSLHNVAARQGLEALHERLIGSVKGERVMEPALLPIGAGLFVDDLPIELILRHMRGDSPEFRAAAVFASIYHRSTDLSVEVAERMIFGGGDKLTLQAMKEVLDLRSRTAVPGGSCERCGEPGTQLQAPIGWLPRRV
jgi:hypothetical protein